MQGCGDRGPAGVALDQPWIPWEEPALCWRLDPDCIFKSLDQKKKKKKLQPHKIFWKNQVKHPCSPDIQSLLSAIIRTFRNPMKTIILMRHYYLRALRQQWRLKGIMHCQNCVISTHSGPVWTSYCLQSSCPNCLPCWEWPSSSI